MATIIEQIRRGIAWSHVDSLQSDYALKDESMVAILGISPRSLTRRRKGKMHLDLVASDRFYRAKRIFLLAGRIFNSRGLAMRWLQRPQPGLGGKVPLEMLDTEPGCDEVRKLLSRIEHGVLP
jgi:putative toxin-antitoxin system antitoxin component (TIGR02293 family)